MLLLLYVACLYHTVPQALKLSTLGSHGTTTVAHQFLPLVTATDGESVCACVCVLCFLWERTHHLKRGETTLRTGHGDTNPHLLPRDSKSNFAATVTTTAAVQRHYNSTSASNSGLCDSHCAFCVLYMCAVFTMRLSPLITGSHTTILVSRRFCVVYSFSVLLSHP